SPSRCNTLVANAARTSGVKCDCPCRHTASGETLNRSAMALLERPVAIARSICGRAGCLQIVQRNPTARFGTPLDSPKLPPECATARINRPWVSPWQSHRSHDPARLRPRGRRALEPSQYIVLPITYNNAKSNTAKSWRGLPTGFPDLKL